MGGLVPVGTLYWVLILFYFTGWCPLLPRRRYIRVLCIANGWGKYVLPRPLKAVHVKNALRFALSPATSSPLALVIPTCHGCPCVPFSGDEAAGG